MQNIIKNNKYDNFANSIALIALIIYLFCLEISESTYFMIPIINKLASHAIKTSFLLTLLKVGYATSRKQYNKKEFLCLIFIGAVFSYSYLRSHVSTPLVVLFFMYSLKTVDSKKIIKYSFYTMLISTIVILLSNAFPSLYQDVRTRYVDGNIKYRYSLGYGYPSICSTYYFALAIMFLIYQNKITIINQIIIFIINITIFLITDTRNVFLCLLILEISCLLHCIIKNQIFKKIFSYITIISFPLGFSLIYILTMIHLKNPNILSKIDHMVNGRITLSAKGFTTWGVSIFGQPISVNLGSTNYNFVDSSYMKMLYNNGLIVVLIVIIFYMLFSFFAYKKKNYILLIALLTLSAKSVFDWEIIELAYYPFIVLFLHLLYSSNTE